MLCYLKEHFGQLIRIPGNIVRWKNFFASMNVDLKKYPIFGASLGNAFP